MSDLSITENEIDEVILFLRRKGESTLANRVEVLRRIKNSGSEDYAAGIDAILEVEKALFQKVPRDLILNRIQYIVDEVKKEL